MGLDLRIGDIEGAKEELAHLVEETEVVGTTNDNYTIIQKDTLVKTVVRMDYGRDLSGITKSSELIEEMLNSLCEVDLVETLTDKIGDDLSKYKVRVTDENGVVEKVVNPLKVTRALYIVAIIEELKIAGDNHGWSMAQQNGMLYLFNGVYWVRMEDSEIKNFIARAAVKMGYYSPADAMTCGFEDAAFKQFMTSSYLPTPVSNTSVVLINLQNGTYEVTEKGGRLREHRKEDFITYSLPFAYDPAAAAPLFSKYLNRVLPNISSQQVLQDFHGYIFTKNLKLEKSMILYGGGRNGKSVQYEITSALLGEPNVSTKSLGDLVSNDAGNDNRAKLKDKLVNYGSEISSGNMDVDMFKRLVSGEPVSARAKYKTSFDLKNNCKFIFNANKLPSNIEHTEAYFRRFLIIPYEQTIPDSETDPELHTKIINNELPGVLNWALEGLNRLLINKKFSECTASKDALNLYKKESNSVAMMVEDEGFVDGRRADKDYCVPTASLYSIYRDYCRESGLRPLSKNDLSKELKLLGFEPYRNSRERGFVIVREAE